MELINNRYRVIKTLSEDNGYSAYLSSDMWNEDKLMQLNIVDQNLISANLKEYFIDHFIDFTGLNNNSLIENYSFDTVSEIGNKMNLEKQYMFTSEYIENKIGLLEFLVDKSVFEIMDIFIKICETINYLHLKGYIYGAINLKNIFILNDNKDDNIRIRDIPTVKLEEDMYLHNGVGNEYFQISKLTDNKASRRVVDIYYLGVLLLSMLKREDCFSNPNEELQNFKETLVSCEDIRFKKEEINFMHTIFPILERLILLDSEYPYKFIVEFVDEINKEVNCQYSVIDKENLEKLNFHTKTIGREKSISSIKEACNKMFEFGSSRKVYVVEGGVGVGKTKFLNEIKFLLRLKGINVYSSFRFNKLNNDKDMWTELMRRIIINADSKIVDRYSKELNAISPDILNQDNKDFIQVFKESSYKFRLLNRIARFIIDSIKDKPSVIIIDNIHLANEFSLDILKYLYAETIDYNNIILIFSYETSRFSDHKFYEFISTITKANDTEIVHMDNLDIIQTGEMIKNILNLDHVPETLTKKIFAKTYGNPFFITETMKELLANKRIYVKKENGLWHIALPEGDIEYNDLNIPNSIEQLFLEQLEGICDKKMEILNIISLSFNQVTLKDLNSVLDIGKEMIEFHLEELINKTILSKEICAYGYFYDIDNKVLKDIIYNRIPDKKKAGRHKTISKTIEDRLIEGEDIDLDELLYHLEKAHEYKKLGNYLIENSTEKYSNRDIIGALKNLEKAIYYTDEENKVLKTELNIRMGKMYLEIEDIISSIECYTRAEILAEFMEDENGLLRVYIGKVEIYNFKRNHERYNYYMEKIYELLKTIDDLEAELVYKHFISRELARKGDFSGAIQLCYEILEKCGDNYIVNKGKAYGTLGFLYVDLNRLEEGLEANKKSIELLSSAGYTRGVVYALNNIGSIYYDNYQNADKALEYYERVREISKENRLLSGELLGSTNVGEVLYDNYDYTLAYEHFESALVKAQKHNYKDDIMFLYKILTSLCLDMNDYFKAYRYYGLTLESSLQDEYFMQEINVISTELYYSFGDFDKALGYAKQLVEDFSETKSKIKYKYSIKYYLLRIIVGNLKSYDSYIDDIIDLSDNIEVAEHRVQPLSEVTIALYRKKDYENAKKVFSILESLNEEEFNDETKGFYYYTKGVIESGEDSMIWLNKALILAQKRKSKLLQANIKIEIGSYLYSREDYYNSIGYYIGASEIIRKIINDIPDEFKLNFINGYNYTCVFYRILHLKEILIEEIPNKIKGTSKQDNKSVCSLKELAILLDEDYSKFTENKEFMNKLVENQIHKCENDIQAGNSILSNLTNDIIGNMELILERLASKTFASKGLIIIEEESLELKVVASLDETMDSHQNRYVFDKLKSSMSPILVSNRLVLNEYEAGLLNEDVKACLYIPIVSGYSKLFLDKNNNSDKKYIPKILGYVYLETEDTLNNFNEETLKEYINYINLIAVLCEKYKLKRITTIDKLTGVLTRKSMEDEIGDLIKRVALSGEKFSIVMYDLDRFKRINDRYGHQTGDEVLKKVSKVVVDNITKEDSIGRYGGEEFIIILPDVDTIEALTISNRIREKISNEKMLIEISHISVSMGIATYPTHGTTVKELIGKADQAMYNAKENGRNRCEVWDKNISDKLKPISKLDGIITGDELKDSRNILSIIETIQLVNSDLDRSEKINSYLRTIIETLQADYGYILLLEDGNVTEKYGRKLYQDGWLSDFHYNEEVVENTIRTKQGIYMIDWKDVSQKDLIVGLPIWNSILVVPIIQRQEIKGVLYFLVSTKKKEFGIDDLNCANVFSNLMPL